MNLYESVKCNLKEDAEQSISNNLQTALSVRSKSGEYPERLMGAIARVKHELNEVNRFIEWFGGPTLTFDELVQFIQLYGESDITMDWNKRLSNTPASYRADLSKQMLSEQGDKILNVMHKIPTNFSNEDDLKNAVDTLNKQLTNMGIFPCIKYNIYSENQELFNTQLKIVDSEPKSEPFIKITPYIQNGQGKHSYKVDAIGDSIYLVPESYKED